MDLNARSLGGEIDYVTVINANGTLPGAPGYNANCNVDHTPGVNAANLLKQCPDTQTANIAGGGTEYITPGLRGQYSNEFIFGAEYEVLPDTKIGITYTHRDLPVVIEDILTDDGSYFITNPGTNIDDQANTLAKTATAEEASSDPAVQAQGKLDAYRASQMYHVKNFDSPQRNYDAVQIQITQRPTKNSLILASYTYSKEQGNFPGLFSTETGQLDPNITSEYDLPSTLANRYGAMGLDRPHLLKVDGFYRFDLKTAGLITLGASVRAQSGIPHNVLGNNFSYGDGETYILQRGSDPRSPMTSSADVHISYGYRITKGTTLEVFADIFNIFNEQQEASQDENYTFSSVNPIVGGDMNDIKHLKTINTTTSGDVNATPILNPNFQKTTAYLQAPTTYRFGFRLTF